MGLKVYVRRERTIDIEHEMIDLDTGLPVNVGEDDTVRVKIGRGNAVAPSLEISSAAATAAGSLVDATEGSNQISITINQDDTADMGTGVYDVEVLLVEAGENGAIRHVEAGVLYLLKSLGGELSNDTTISTANLSGASFDLIWSRLTDAEFLTMLKAEGYVVNSATIDSELRLRPDGVLSNLHYNNGNGYLATETAGANDSPARYVGKLLKDPGQATYSTSTTYHMAPEAIKAALRADWNSGNAARLELLQASAELSSERISEVISPLPSTSISGNRTTVGIVWGELNGATSEASISHAIRLAASITWTQVNGSPASLRTATAVQSTLATYPAGKRIVRSHVDYFPRETSSGVWTNCLYDGLFQTPIEEPGLWLEEWESEIIGTLGDKGHWWQWCEAWQALFEEGELPIDWILLNGEFGQGFYSIKTAATDLSAPFGQPGKFDGVGNSIYSDSRWALTVGEIGIEDSGGNDLWHMTDTGHASYWNNWNHRTDERVMLFSAWVRKSLHAKYQLIVSKAREFDAFANTKFVCYDHGMFASPTYPCGPANIYPFYHGAGVGHVNSASLYGTSLKDVYVFGSGLESKPAVSAWNTFVYEMKIVRAQQACSRHPQVGWIMTKSHPLQNSHFRSSDMWDEFLIHLLLSGESVRPFFYPDSTSVNADWTVVDAIIGEVDDVLIGVSQKSILGSVPQYTDIYMASTVDCGGKFVTRITPHPDATIATSSSGGTLTVTVVKGADSAVLSYPTGTVVAPSGSDLTAGVWVSQSQLF